MISQRLVVGRIERIEHLRVAEHRPVGITVFRGLGPQGCRTPQNQRERTEISDGSLHVSVPYSTGEPVDREMISWSGA